MKIVGFDGTAGEEWMVPGKKYLHADGYFAGHNECLCPLTARFNGEAHLHFVWTVLYSFITGRKCYKQF